jgi:hypothetical protein
MHLEVMHCVLSRDTKDVYRPRDFVDREHVPIVHIVGMPSTASQKDGMLLHQTLGNGNLNVSTLVFRYRTV